MAHQFVRTDRWGGYNPREKWDERIKYKGRWRKRGKVTTYPHGAERDQRQLSLADLEQHFRATAPEHIIGPHSTSANNFVISLGIDLDAHDGSLATAQANERMALALYAMLTMLGFSVLLTTSDGRGGLHLRILFSEPVPSHQAYAFLQYLVSTYADYGLASPPETFPKQPSLKGLKYGNWLRLFGRHHTRPHWSKAWNGSQWLQGEAAVQHVLSLTGSSPDLLPPAPATAPRSPAAERARQSRTASEPRPEWPTDRPIPLHRIVPYMARKRNSAKPGRHALAYQAAAFLVRDLALPDAVALPFLVEWDKKNSPPLGSRELEYQVYCAHKYGTHPYGSGYKTTPSPSKGEEHIYSSPSLHPPSACILCVPRVIKLTGKLPITLSLPSADQIPAIRAAVDQHLPIDLWATAAARHQRYLDRLDLVFQILSALWRPLPFPLGVETAGDAIGVSKRQGARFMKQMEHNLKRIERACEHDWEAKLAREWHYRPPTDSP